MVEAEVRIKAIEFALATSTPYYPLESSTHAEYIKNVLNGADTFQEYIQPTYKQREEAKLYNSILSIGLDISSRKMNMSTDVFAGMSEQEKAQYEQDTNTLELYKDYLQRQTPEINL